jgi:hypothetical protein
MPCVGCSMCRRRRSWNCKATRVACAAFNGRHDGVCWRGSLTLMSLGLYNEPAGAFLPSILF